LARRGKTVILSSHLLGDVEDVCDRVCILYGGRRQALGGVDELLCQQSYTQFTTDRLDEATLDRVGAVLASAGRRIRQVAAPRQKLEDLFLRIVKNAQESRVKTGGATAGGGVARFLRGPDASDAPGGRAVIEGLLAAATADSSEAQAQAAAPAPPPANGPAGDVISDLVTPAGGADQRARDGDAERLTEQHRAAAAAAGRQADRSVIDALTGGKPDPGDRDAAGADQPGEAGRQ
jgi:ABC-2 type transport system ATP-binding protein